MCHKTKTIIIVLWPVQCEGQGNRWTISWNWFRVRGGVLQTLFFNFPKPDRQPDTQYYKMKVSVCICVWMFICTQIPNIMRNSQHRKFKQVPKFSENSHLGAYIWIFSKECLINELINFDLLRLNRKQFNSAHWEIKTIKTTLLRRPWKKILIFISFCPIYLNICEKYGIRIFWLKLKLTPFPNPL